ncbi:hypothetical protein ccbrp13_18080 [Ktedonobacteria bacterium brp13]|nr:hypothetical protein ccbrp13_18080 [Ktedonobacteria bacterium brp13]
MPHGSDRVKKVGTKEISDFDWSRKNSDNGQNSDNEKHVKYGDHVPSTSENAKDSFQKELNIVNKRIKKQKGNK